MPDARGRRVRELFQQAADLPPEERATFLDEGCGSDTELRADVQTMAGAMNLTATSLPYGQSEFEWAGVTPAPSETIRVPRVAEAPVAFECKLQRIVMVSEQPGGGAAVFGEVQRIHLRDDLYVDGHVPVDKLKPIGRLGGNGYVRVTDTFEMERVPPPNQVDKK